MLQRVAVCGNVLQYIVRLVPWQPWPRFPHEYAICCSVVQCFVCKEPLKQHQLASFRVVIIVVNTHYQFSSVFFHKVFLIKGLTCVFCVGNIERNIDKSVKLTFASPRFPSFFLVGNIERTSSGVPFRKIAPLILWKGFTFNPGLRRMSDYKVYKFMYMCLCMWICVCLHLHIYKHVCMRI